MILDQSTFVHFNSQKNEGGKKMNKNTANNSFLPCQKLTNSELGGGTKPYKIRAKAVFNNISS